MGTLKNKANTPKQKDEKNAAMKYTSKGNKLIEFTRVSEEERKKLRVDVYGYIL